MNLSEDVYGKKALQIFCFPGDGFSSSELASYFQIKRVLRIQNTEQTQEVRPENVHA